MENYPIAVVVVGPSGSGKSTVMEIIADALKQAGLQIELRPADETPHPALPALQAHRLQKLTDKNTKVIVEERPTYKPHGNDESHYNIYHKVLK